MKQFLFTLLFAITFVATTTAQGVSVSGYVTDANGTPQAGQTVIIQGDSLTGYVSAVFTDTTGYYADVVPTGITTQGQIMLLVFDPCTGLPLPSIVNYSPSNMSFPNTDFVVCSTSSSCQAAINTTVVDSLATFTVTTTGGTAPYSYFWDFGDGSNGVSTANATTAHIYPFAGTYTACVTVTDLSGCITLSCDTVAVTAGSGVGNCTISTGSSTNGLSASFWSYPFNAVYPVAYAWDFGDGNTSTTATPHHTYAAAGTYAVSASVTDALGCVASDSFSVTVAQPTTGDLWGFIIKDSTTMATVQSAEVFIVAYDSIAGTLTAVGTGLVDSTGIFYFTNLPFGTYLVKAALLPADPDYAQYLPTYFFNSLYWSNAFNVEISSSHPSGFAIIDLIDGNNVGGGSGFIGGSIVQGANGPGDPMEGVLVLLFDAAMNPIGYTYTDANGDYSFSNLPMGGYYVYIEHLGMQASPIEVTLSMSTPSITNMDFEMNSTNAAFTNVNHLQSIEKLALSPNPTSDVLTLQMELTQAIDANILITNMSGQVMMTQNATLNNGTRVIQLSVESLPRGVYTLQIQNEEGVATQLFIKQ